MGETQHQVVERLSEQQIISQIEQLLELAKTEGLSGYSQSPVDGISAPGESLTQAAKPESDGYVRTFKLIDRTTSETGDITTIAGMTMKSDKHSGESQQPKAVAVWTALEVSKNSKLKYSFTLTISPDKPGIEYACYHTEDPLSNRLDFFGPETEKYSELLGVMQKDIDTLTEGK